MEGDAVAVEEDGSRHDRVEGRGRFEPVSAVSLGVRTIQKVFIGPVNRSRGGPDRVGARPALLTAPRRPVEVRYGEDRTAWFPDMGTPLDSREAQADEVVHRLYDRYPEPEISLDFSNRLELLVAVVLSAQCTDERVNGTTPELFEKYPTAADYAAADENELAEDVYGITFHNSKAGYLKGIGEILVAEHDGEVPDTMSALTELPGVGRKTANVVLQHGHEVVEGIVVDTHVQRISRRLGLTTEERPERIEADLMEIVPESEWKEFTHLLISHGRATCTARGPDCEDCTLEDVCPSSMLDHDTDLASGEAW
jgi:endonuclease-3